MGEISALELIYGVRDIYTTRVRPLYSSLFHDDLTSSLVVLLRYLCRIHFNIYLSIDIYIGSRCIGSPRASYIR